MSEPFFDVPQKAVATSQGSVALPILYFDVSVFQAFFRVEAASAEKFLAGTGLRPSLMAGKAFVGIAFFEYRKTSIGPYNEVGVCLATYLDNELAPPNVVRDLLRPSWERKLGFHILDLPVTTEAACAAGREIWGYPKFVTQIPFDMDPRGFRGAVLEPQATQPIMALEGSYGMGLPLPAIDLVLYSLKNGTIVKTVVDVDSKMHTTAGGGLRLTVGNSRHRMAENLRALGLDGAEPFLIQRTTKFRSRLHDGRPVRDGNLVR